MFNQLETSQFALYRICTEFRPSADPSNDPQSGLKERLFLGSNLQKICSNHQIFGQQSVRFIFGTDKVQGVRSYIYVPCTLHLDAKSILAVL